MHFTLRQLQVFEAVARHLSFTRAAEELHLTQPAVSMQIKQLESSVELPLLEQVGKKVYLTEPGRVLLDHSRRIADCLSSAREELNDLRGTEGGRLRVGVVSTVNYFATKLLAAFTRAYPEVQITLDVGNRREILHKLESNEPDIVLMGEPPPDIDAVAEPFMRNPLVMICAPDNPLARRRRLAPSRLDGLGFVVRESGSGTRAAMERFFDHQGVRPGRIMELTGNEAIKQAVRAGIGLAVVSAHTIELERDAGLVAIVPVTGFPLQRQWFVVRRNGKRLSLAAEAFRAFVLSHEEAVRP